jgi:chitin-binding protein
VPWVLAQQSIILDTTKPTTPGTLTRSASCSGSTRTVHLSWGAASDTNLVGYRVLRSTDGVTWQIVNSTTGTTATDSNSKTLTSVRFYIKAYDKAGNESNATNTITFSKNQCS